MDFTRVLPFLKPKRPNLLGLDITSAAVKLLELSRAGENFRVESFAIAALEEGTIIDNVVKKPDAVTQAIEKVLHTSGTDNKRVAIAVADASAITKIIQMSAELVESGDEAMENLIIAEADKYIPYAVDEINFDFEIIGPSSKNSHTVDILLVASHKENIELRIDAVSAAGLTVDLVDVESYAMERASGLLLKKALSKKPNQLVAIIDIGATTTAFTVLSNQVTIFSRTEMFGGQLLTKEIQQRYGLSLKEAGLAKRKGGLPDDYYSEVVNSFREMAVIHLRRCLQLFYSASQHAELEHIFLAGGTANTNGLVNYIQEQLNISTTIANPFVDMIFPSTVNAAALASNAPALMTSCGLALRSFQ